MFVRACVRVCMCVCMRACARVCVCIGMLVRVSAWVVSLVSSQPKPPFD